MTTSLARWSSIALLAVALPAAVAAQSSRVAVTAERRERVAAEPRIPMAAHEIARGVVLAPADIGYLSSERVANRVARSATAPADLEPAAESDTLVGWMTRRLIVAGEPLRAPAVTPPQLVKAGDLVDVMYQGDGVQITMRGRATKSAAFGERLTVRMDNQRRLDATVVAAGRVRVN